MIMQVESEINKLVDAGKACYVREPSPLHTCVKCADGKEHPVTCVGHLCSGAIHYMLVVTGMFGLHPVLCEYGLIDTAEPPELKDGFPRAYGVAEVVDYLGGLTLD